MIARTLTLYETYTRQDVHDIFEPSTRFTPQAGTWGLWGIVPVPGKAGDFVFFVTFGKEQAGHHFDEWVSLNGIINWQSQPRQGLADRQIQQFIQHDPTKNNSHLFLRTNKTVPYTYLGRLAYHAHDPKRERPVYIQWQILDWNPPLAHLQAMGLTLRVEEPQPAQQSAETAFFEWRGVQYPVDLANLRAIVQRHIRAGLPAEALRFRDWYVELEGQRLSAKWLFHLLTNADYSEFDAPTARDKLEKIGIQSHQVPEVAEPDKDLPAIEKPITPSSPTEQISTPTQPEGFQSPAKKVQFEWKEKVYRYDAQQLHGSLHKRVQDGLPEDALRFNKWYLSAAGQAISPKWVFHRLTKLDYEQFTTQQARDKVIQLELPVFYQASHLDIQHGCTVVLTPSNSVVEDVHPTHQAFAQAFASKINSVFRNGKLIFPNSQNQREVHYSLADLGQGFLRQNRNGGLELSFEFSSSHEPSDALRQKLVLLIPEAQKVLGYPVFVNKLEKDAWRVGSEIIAIDAWFPLNNGLGEEKLDGKNVPAHWDEFYQKVKQAHPQSHLEDIADTLFGMALAEFANAVVPIIQQSIQFAKPAEDMDVQELLPEIKMGKKRNYIGSTIRRLSDLILDLAQLGEIGQEALSKYGLGDSHVLQLVQSGWAISTPYALVATPRLLNVLPIENRESLNELLHLSNWDYQGWGNFEQKAFHLSASPRYPQLDFKYIYTPKSNSMVQDTLWRPIWLVNYLPEDDWDDWEISTLMQTYPCRREAKLYIHSALPIQNIYGGIPEAQDAAWKTAFYWLALQLMILSDPQTGGLYDPPIQISLSNDWRDNSIARLYLQSEYIGDLVDCLEALMACFHWVWVNRSGNTAQDQQAVLGLLRLLLKIDIAELGKDGRLQFTDDCRLQLFESQAKARLHYLNSKDARDQLRQVIKEMSR
jgi:hypothetical protein